MDKNQMSKNIFYNTFGTFFYFFCQWLLTILVVRLSGYEDAGILSLVISTTNIFYFITLFGIRNYQVSDINNRYSDKDYICSKFITITITWVLFMITMVFINYNQKTILCCFIYIFYKFGETISDTFFGIFQRQESYRKIAVSCVLKGLLTIITFSFVLKLTEDLVITLVVMTIIYTLILWLYDGRCIHLNKYTKYSLMKVKPLLRHCFPLMIYGLILPYLNFIVRFSIEGKYGTVQLGYYSSVTMVFVVLSTLMNSVFLSINPKIASLFHQKQWNKIKKIVVRVVFIIFIMGIIACIGGYILGDFIFSLIFGKSILQYMYLLIPTIIASVILTYVSFFSSTLIAIGVNRGVLYANIISPVLCTILIIPLINIFGMRGSLWCLTISLFAGLIALIGLFFGIFYSKKRYNDNHKFQANL